MASQGTQFSIRPLQPHDLDDVKRLHKYATQAGKPVFAQYGDDAATVLEAAAAGVAGAFGVAVLAADPDEPGEEPDLVGAATAQADEQQQGGGELVLLTLVVRADVRQQGVGRLLLQALLEQAAQRSAAGQPCTRLVTDIALANKQAWQFFTAMGFTRGAASGQTAEAWLMLQPGSRDAPAARTLPPAATAALCSCLSASTKGRRTLTGCGTSGALRAMPLSGRPVVQHVPRSVVLQRGLYQAVHKRAQVSSVMAKVRVGMATW